jgi:hypothetical protein
MTRYNMKRSGFRMLNMPSECPDMRDRVPAVLCRATACVNSTTRLCQSRCALHMRILQMQM